MKHSDPLSDLWQQQTVTEPDSQQVMFRWRSMRRKQLLYLAGDVISMILALGVCIYLFVFKPQTWWLIKFWAVLMTVIGGYFTYVVIKRRQPIFTRPGLSTEEYYQLLLGQCDNNIYIARFCWKMCIWVFYLVLGFLVMYGLLADISLWDMVIKAIKTLIFLSLFSLCFYWWAKGHIRRNMQEKKRLLTLDSSSENGE